jgi:hypothetical protein
MPRCSHRRPDHRGKSESLARILAAQDSTRNQVPLIPASRRHNYANDPPPGSPLFLHLPFRCAQEQTVQRSCCPLPCVVQKSWPTRSSHLSAAYFPSCSHFICPLFLCSLATRPGLVRVPFSRDFRLEARCGTREFGFRNVLGLPVKPFPLGSGTRQ